MQLRRIGLIPAAVLALIPLAINAQQPSVRDAFWSSSDLITVTPNPAAHKRSVTHPTHSLATNSSSSSNSKGPGSSNQESAAPKALLLVSENGYGAAPHLVRAADNRLGLRCSILLRQADGQYAEVAPGTVFHSGDHIRLSLLANESGYLYVIEQGSSGAWSPIFPLPGTVANKITAGQLQTVPSGERAFAFDQHPGDEKLYVILSRTPIEDIDRAVRNLKNGQPAAPEPSPSPAGSPVLVAENKIPDFFVKQMASRDLTLVDEQKVDESSTNSQSGEKAIYVVSKVNSAQSTSQVVLSLDLSHD
jgi:hypothetical protein